MQVVDLKFSQTFPELGFNIISPKRNASIWHGVFGKFLKIRRGLFSYFLGIANPPIVLIILGDHINAILGD
jgi:hypothetical protein